MRVKVPYNNPHRATRLINQSRRRGRENGDLVSSEVDHSSKVDGFKTLLSKPRMSIMDKLPACNPTYEKYNH